MADQKTNDAIRLLAQKLLQHEYADLPSRDKRIIERVAKRVAISRDIYSDDERAATLGERMADSVASFGGSWTFLILFSIVLIIWVAINSLMLSKAFDPYPYILLNLFLSMLASIQAPIIMMSQNRQAAKDRKQALHDYEVNLKAEIEIMALHDKLDQIRSLELAELLKVIGEQNATSKYNRRPRAQ